MGESRLTALAGPLIHDAKENYKIRRIRGSEGPFNPPKTGAPASDHMIVDWMTTV